MLIAAHSHRRQGLVAVHLILFSVSPLGALAASDQATDERKGRTIVQINCATCHAVGRQGDSPMTKAPPFRDLHKRYPVENLQEALGEGIATGHATMPEFKFEPKQVDEIIDYLKTLERQRPRDKSVPQPHQLNMRRGCAGSSGDLHLRMP
jgi:cytochrome c